MSFYEAGAPGRAESPSPSREIVLGILVGILVALFKADQAGLQARIGNLVAPWLVPAFLAAYRRRRLWPTVTTAWLATALSLVAFYVLQALVWGIYSGVALPYYVFWVLAGPTVCAVLAAALLWVPRSRSLFVGVWAGLSSVLAFAYLGYLSVPDPAVNGMTGSVLIAGVLLAGLSLAALRRHRRRSAARPVADRA